MIVAVTRAEVESGEAEVESSAVDSTSVARRKDRSLFGNGEADDGEVEKRFACGGDEQLGGKLKSAAVVPVVSGWLLWVRLFLFGLLSSSEAVWTLGLLNFGQSPLARSVLVSVFRGFSGSLVDDGELGRGLLCSGEDVRNGRSKSIPEIGGCGKMLLWFSVGSSCGEVVVALGSVICGQSPLSRSVLVSAYTGEGQSSEFISGSAGNCRATRFRQSPLSRSVIVASDP